MKKKSKYLIIICFSLLIDFTLTGQIIVRGPYLQKGTSTSVVVKWRTDTNDSSIIEFSNDAGFSSKITSSDATPKTEHELEITGLLPNTKYFYRIGINGSLLIDSPDLYFKTHPTLGTSQPYRFWVLGDCGTADTNAMAVRDAYYEDYPGSSDTDGILFLGDNAYLNGTDAQFQAAVFDMYPDILKNTISWSCFGNHEGWWKSTTGYPENFAGSPYFDIYTFPTAGESGGMPSGTEAYYSFDYGNIHFIVLDSFGTDRSATGAMHTWAENDIQNTTQKWIVAFWHHPPYSKGSHDSDDSITDIELVEMRENFLPMLEANGVDLVLGGHSHAYERSYLLNGHYGLSDSFHLHDNTIGGTGSGDGKINGDGAYSKTSIGDDANLGTVYVVTGSAGKKSGGSLDHEAMYYSVSQLGSSILEVDGNNLTLKFLRDTGTIDDIFTIHKGPDYVYDDGWIGSDPNGIDSNTEDIVIKSGTTAITSNTTINTIVVNPEANLTINTGVNLAVNSITMESSSTKYSSLFPASNSNSISGKVEYDRYVNTNSNGNDLISPPVTNSGQTFASFAAINSNIVSNTSPITEKLFGPFDKGSSSYLTYDTAVPLEADLTLDAGIGYRAASTGTGGTFTFNGEVLTGLVTTNIVNSGAQYAKWNLIGNPYPSYLKVDDGANGFLNNTNNTALIDPNSVGIYGYDSDDSVGGGGSIWTIYNLANSDASTLIAPGQGFFVATQVGGLIEFTPEMRSIGTTDDFIAGRNTNEANDAHLRLNLISDTNFSLTDFYFNDNSSLGLDPGYDASVFGGVAPDFAIYSHLVEDNFGIDFGIQSLAYADINDIIVPIGINAPQGEQLRVKIGESTVPSDVDIYFQDNIANSSHLLNSGDYIFTSDSDLSGTGRFYLRFTSSTLTLEDSYIDDLQIYASFSPKTIYINGRLSDMATVVLYDIQGRSVLREDLDRNSYSNKIDISAISSGIYIVKLKNGSSNLSQKIIIK